MTPIQHADMHIYIWITVIKSFSVHKFCMRKLRRAQMLVKKGTVLGEVTVLNFESNFRISQKAPLQTVVRV